ncbi:MAG: PfkB family carbohydrate kinase [Actinomycetota bacterium]|nr:PfkB family carbohydrate kinase [Actinomycetota bacterium]
MRAAAVGHLEWVEFVSVAHVPRCGEIVHAQDRWEEPGGGGAGGAVQLQKLAGSAAFFTALGDDDIGDRARSFLNATGLRVEAVVRPEPSRRAITFVEPDGERTITVLGARLAPRGQDPLPWEELDGCDAVYFTAGDADALRAARQARVLVATTRILPLLATAGVYLDAIVGSASDEGELYSDGDLDPRPGLVVMTDGEGGGWFETAGGRRRTYGAVALRGPVVDRYGAGDSFAAGLTFALGRRDAVPDAVHLGARCGAAAVTGRGPYAGQLRRADL